MHRFSFSLVVATLVLGGCYGPKFAEGLPCSETRQCPVGQFCDSNNICLREGTGEPDAGEIPLDCEPNELTCESDVLTQCNGEGTGGVQTDCALGCHETDVRCNKLDPSNGLAEHLDDAEANGPDVILSDGATFDTETGIVTNGDGTVVDVPSVLLPAPNDGIEVQVFKFGSLTMGSTTTIGSKGIAIVSAGDVEVLGSFELGQFVTRSGGACDFFPDYIHSGTPGGAGGGFGEIGGAGGEGSGALGAPGGGKVGNAELTPLRGGCHGQYSCESTDSCANNCGVTPCPVRGRGGGALQLVSASSISIGAAGFDGAIQAHGTGGIGEDDPVHSGAGGGSGGGILLEAPILSLVGAMTANGGGGGCRDRGAGAGDRAGSPNGAGCGAPSGSGGSGGTVDRAAIAGANGSGTAAGGSGGGSVGRIRVNTAVNGFSTGPLGAASPQPSMGLAGIR